MPQIISIRMYKSISGWATMDNEQQNTEQENDADTTAVIIGEAEYSDGNKEYVTEQIYTELLSDILDRPREYAIHTIPGKVPQLFITSQGSILCHNPVISSLVDFSKKVIRTLDPGTLCEAEMEIGQKLPVTQQYAVQEVTLNISKKLDMELPVEFIKAVISEYFIEYYTGRNQDPIAPLRKYLAGLDYPVLETIIGELNKARLTSKLNGRISLDIIKTFKCKPDQFLMAVKEELFVRALTHRLKGTQ